MPLRAFIVFNKQIYIRSITISGYVLMPLRAFIVFNPALDMNVCVKVNGS